MAKAHQEFGPKGVVFVGISVRDTEESAKKFVADNGLAFPNGLDQQGVDDRGQPYWKIARAFRVEATPTTFLITPDGQILGRNNGTFPEAQLQEALQTLVNYGKKR